MLPMQSAATDFHFVAPVGNVPVPSNQEQAGTMREVKAKEATLKLAYDIFAAEAPVTFPGIENARRAAKKGVYTNRFMLTFEQDMQLYEYELVDLPVNINRTR
jgi:hypothetical protein